MKPSKNIFEYDGNVVRFVALGGLIETVELLSESSVR